MTTSAPPDRVFLDRVLENIWDKYDCNKNGILNAKEFKKVLRDFTATTVSHKDVLLVMKNIDQDGVGTLGKKELKTFIYQGMGMSDAAKQEYADRGEIQKVVVHFLQGINAQVKLLRHGPSSLKQSSVTVDALLDSLWQKYDVDADGYLNAVELKALVGQFTGLDVSEENTTQFLQSMDKDGNALIDKSELCVFVKQGIKLSQKARNLYAGRGEFHEQVVRFFNGIDRELFRQQKAAISIHATVKIDQLIESIWHRYDKDRDGFLNSSELKKMMEDFTGHTVSQEDTQSFLDSVDQDGNALIQKSELSSFIMKGTELSENARRAYQNRSAFHSKVVDFFYSIDKEMLRLNATALVAQKKLPSSSDGVEGGVPVTSLSIDCEIVGKSRSSSHLQTKMPTITVSSLVHSVWSKYDKDRDDYLNAKELQQFVADFTGHSINEKDTKEFLANMDTDGDSLIAEPELVSFLQKGIKLSQKSREVYSQRGLFHKQVVDFFNGIERELILRRKKVLGLDTKTSVDALIKSIWTKYDVDSDNHLNSIELKQLIVDFTGHTVNETETQEFLENIDSDGDALVDQAELRAFVKKGMALSVKARNTYACRGVFHRKVVDFFLAVDKKILKDRVSMNPVLVTSTSRSHVAYFEHKKFLNSNFSPKVLGRPPKKFKAASNDGDGDLAQQNVYLCKALERKDKEIQKLRTQLRNERMEATNVARKTEAMKSKIVHHIAGTNVDLSDIVSDHVIKHTNAVSPRRKKLKYLSPTKKNISSRSKVPSSLDPQSDEFYGPFPSIPRISIVDEMATLNERLQKNIAKIPSTQSDIKDLETDVVQIIQLLNRNTTLSPAKREK